MENSSSLSTCTIGIDVSKKKLDFYVLPLNDHFTVENTPKGIRQLLPKLPKSQATKMVALEATSRFEKCVKDILIAQGYQVHVAHPSRVYHFGQSEKGYAKTDKIDSRMLAEFARKDTLVPSPLPDKHVEILEELSARRSQLITIRNAEKSRLSGKVDPIVVRSIKRFIKSIDNELLLIDQELEKRIEQREDLEHRRALIETCKGVGKVTAVVLVSCLPELGLYSRKEITAMAGLAPYNRDSGERNGKRTIKYGRSHIRSALYMCCLSAVRFNPALKEFYNQLLAKGKPKRLAQVAVMRKLLITLNAMVKNNVQWSKDYAKDRHRTI